MTSPPDREEAGPAIGAAPRDRAVPGYASGPDAPLRATALALEGVGQARSILLVEGISDQIAVETLAGLQGRTLAAEGVAVIPIGGVHAVGRFLARFGPEGAGLRVGGLCDAGEERHVAQALARIGQAAPATRAELERAGFFVCDRDLEDELIRAVGPETIEAILAAQGDLGAFRTLRKQAAWRERRHADQVRRFLGAGAGRKLRYAGLLVRALDVVRQPAPLRNLLAWA